MSTETDSLGTARDVVDGCTKLVQLVALTWLAAERIADERRTHHSVNEAVIHSSQIVDLGLRRIREIDHHVWSTLKKEMAERKKVTATAMYINQRVEEIAAERARGGEDQ